MKVRMSGRSAVKTEGIRRLGRYELLAEIGRGGMAELYLAQLHGVGGFAKIFAIKRILPHLASDPQFVEMFLNEGRIASRLSHPNICQVFEIVQDDDQLYLVMEYLEGVSLDELSAAIPRDPEAPLLLAAGIFGQIAEGLHYAHSLRDRDGRETPIVHRDVSPHNLFVTADGLCKLLDFGVSKIKTDEHMTRSGVVKGKLSYMPPEQFRAEEVDARADVFALGVVVWEFLTGARLFQRESEYLVWRAMLEEPIPSVREHAPDLDPAIDTVLGRALARERDGRYPSVRAFIDELTHVARARGHAHDAGEIARTVRAHCAPHLAERGRRLATVTGGGSPGVEPARPTNTMPLEREGVGGMVKHGLAPMPADQVEDSSAPVPVPEARRSRAWIAVASVFVIAAAGIVFALWWTARAADGETEAAAATVAEAPASTPVVTPIEPKPDPDPDPESESTAHAMTPSSPAAAPTRSKRHHRSRRSRSTRAAAANTDASAKPGFYTVDSHPYATIYVDGKRKDQTPLFRIELPAGKHVVRAVLADGRQRRFKIVVKPGAEVSSGTLTW